MYGVFVHNGLNPFPREFKEKFEKLEQAVAYAHDWVIPRYVNNPGAVVYIPLDGGNYVYQSGSEWQQHADPGVCNEPCEPSESLDSFNNFDNYHDDSQEDAYHT